MNLRRGNAWLVVSRVFVGVCVLALFLVALPMWAGQNQQGHPAAAVQQTNSAAPTDAATPDQQDQQGQSAVAGQQTDPPAPVDAPEDPAHGYQQVPPQLTIPAGTVISVRVSDFLSSDQNQIGDGFNAELKQPLVVDGWVVARRGQTVLGRVSVVQKGGRVKGVSQLGVELNHLVLVDGQQLAIKTQLQQISAGPSKERDGQAIGVATVLGALIGAASGEGKGAAIGAGAGAAAGIAGVLLTRGRSAEITPESVLTFQLQAPLAFSTERSVVAFRPVNQDDYENGKLRNRPQPYAAGPGYPPPPFYYGGYYSWGYDYSPFYFGFGYSRFGGHDRGNFRR